MRVLSRRGVLAVGGTLASAPFARKLFAAENLPSVRLHPLDPSGPAPDIVFTLADGTERRLSEFRGHGMVLNFWATWCGPCVAEMPALAALSRALAPDNIAVMPLSSDRGGAAVVRRFYTAREISGLPVLLDPNGAGGRAFDLRGIPATVVIDKRGRFVARMDGAADWAAPEVAARIRRLVG
jgi:thiol-disulfide isomerase/thioredoxin